MSTTTKSQCAFGVAGLVTGLVFGLMCSSAYHSYYKSPKQQTRHPPPSSSSSATAQRSLTLDPSITRSFPIDVDLVAPPNFEDEDDSLPHPTSLQDLQSVEADLTKAYLNPPPLHIAIIMDGNRRYSLAQAREASSSTSSSSTPAPSPPSGHWSGARSLLRLISHLLLPPFSPSLKYVTVYAVSTENWSRPADEVSLLLGIFVKYSRRIKTLALREQVRVRVWCSSGRSGLPPAVLAGVLDLEESTRHFRTPSEVPPAGGAESSPARLTLTICLSYGSRLDIVNAARSLCQDVLSGSLPGGASSGVDEVSFAERLSSGRLGAGVGGGGETPDPDLVVRTSGEMRLSNFLLWELAYAEMFFLNKHWPDVTGEDFREVWREYREGRTKRLGK